MSRTPQRPRRSPPDCSIIGNSGTHCKNLRFLVRSSAALRRRQRRRTGLAGPAVPAPALRWGAGTCGGAPAVRPRSPVGDRPRAATRVACRRSRAGARRSNSVGPACGRPSRARAALGRGHVWWRPVGAPHAHLAVSHDVHPTASPVGDRVRCPAEHACAAETPLAANRRTRGLSYNTNRHRDCGW